MTMLRLADAKKAAGTLALSGLAGCSAAAAVWCFNAPARAPAVPDRGAGRGAFTSKASAQSARVASDASAPPLPVSLAGSMPPRLPLDERGHLRKARGVRDFFDYFLTAENEVPPAALDALVRKHIAKQLDGTTAQREAIDVWQRYGRYLETLAGLAPLSPVLPLSGAARTGDLDAMRSALDERAAVASRTLGADWSEAFFGRDWRQAHYMIERWRVQRDSTLTDAQKADRLQALDASLPPEERAAREKQERAQARVQAVGQLAQQGMTLDELRAEASRQFGPEAAERIVKMRQADDAWRSRYADYAAQRASIDAMGLASAEREARIAQLRQRMFDDPAQALRAAALDRGGRR